MQILFFRQLQSLTAVGRFQQPVSWVRQVDLQGVHNVGLVVANQDVIHGLLPAYIIIRSHFKKKRANGLRFY